MHSRMYITVMLVLSFICSLEAGGFVTGMVDICLYGTSRSSSKLAPWNARHSTSGCHVACVERGWHRIFVLGCELLWESNCSQCRGDCVACLCYVMLENNGNIRTCYTVLLLSYHWYIFVTDKIQAWPSSWGWSSVLPWWGILN